MNHTEHISLYVDSDGRLVLSITDDTELFDFLEDYLTEDCDLTYDFMRLSTSGRREMVFKQDESFEHIRKQIKQIPETKIQEIYLINSSPSG